MLDPYKVREDFPLLQTTLVKGKKLVYLDNAATTQKPVQVVEAVRKAYYTSYANVHRGHHELSQKSSEVYEEAHEVIARFLGASDWREIVLAFNTTTAMNYIAPSLSEYLARRGKKRIIITMMEHHGSMLPWRRAAPLFGLRVEYAPVNREGLLDMGALEAMIDDDVGAVVVTHASNVTGVVNDLRKISGWAHQHDALLVVDGAQSVPHLPINVTELGIDFITFSGHKMMAPDGTGGFYGRLDVLEEMTPWVVGGGAIKEVTIDDVVYADLPWRFEPGTPNITGAAGLIEAVEYLRRLGMDQVHAHEKRLVTHVERYLGEVDGVESYLPRGAFDLTGIFPFNIRRLNPHIVGQLLNDQYGIAVRTGLHCAHVYHRAMGLEEGTVRASFYIYNTVEEAALLVDAVGEIARKYAPT